MFCLKIGHPDLIIVFHDSNIIYRGIFQIFSYLRENNYIYKKLKMQGSIYIILLNNAIDLYYDSFSSLYENGTKYFLK